MRELIIKPEYTGLGDHLFFTPIPRIAKKMGYDRVFMSSQATFRNPLYKYYIWQCNPYLDGFKDAPPTFSEKCRAQDIHGELHMKRGNIVDHVLRIHGLDDKQLWHKPELYFEVKPNAQFNNATVFDASFLSTANGPLGLAACKEKIRKWIFANGFKIDYQLTYSSYKNLYLEDIGERLECPDFIEYSSIVASCSRFFCLFSGSFVLAVALGKHPDIFYFGRRIEEHRSIPKQVRIAKNFILRNRGVCALTKAAVNEMQDKLRLKTKPKMFLESTFIAL